MTLDTLADLLTRRMITHEVVTVIIVALSMFVIWNGPGGPVGTVLVVAVGAVLVLFAWAMPASALQGVRMDTVLDPNAAADQMTALAKRTLRTLQVPVVLGFLLAPISGGWQPVVFGALISIGGFTFLGPSRTRLAAWRDRMEDAGGKTGL